MDVAGSDSNNEFQELVTCGHNRKVRSQVLAMGVSMQGPVVNLRICCGPRDSVPQGDRDMGIRDRKYCLDLEFLPIFCLGIISEEDLES